MKVKRKDIKSSTQNSDKFNKFYNDVVIDNDTKVLILGRNGAIKNLVYGYIIRGNIKLNPNVG